ncbi:MAG TPA: hypothetical protein VM098_04655 [Phycisphaerae bacterium]|nr:hypothetical protein [Phycisphaerae bacterium]
MASPDQLREVREGDVPSASQWNIMVALLKRRVTGPNIYEDSTGWHFRESASTTPAAGGDSFQCYSRTYLLYGNIATGTWTEVPIQVGSGGNLAAGIGTRMQGDGKIIGLSVEWMNAIGGAPSLYFRAYNTTDNDATNSPTTGTIASGASGKGEDATGLDADDDEEISLQFKHEAGVEKAIDGFANVTFVHLLD